MVLQQINVPVGFFSSPGALSFRSRRREKPSKEFLCNPRVQCLGVPTMLPCMRGFVQEGLWPFSNMSHKTHSPQPAGSKPL